MNTPFDAIEDKEALISSSEQEIFKDMEYSMSGYLQSRSIDISRDVHLNLPEENTVLAFTFMIISVLGMTMNHIFAKIAFYNNPNLSTYDWLLFLGIAVFPTYLIANWSTGRSVSLLSLKPNARVLVILSAVFSINVYYLNLWGISLISITKSTLVFDLNPLFCIILAFIFLGEPLNKVNTTFAVGAFAGIYFLTLNKTGEDGEGDFNAMLGITLVWIAAWGQASVMIVLRTLNIHQVHYLFRPVYSGLAFLTFTALIQIFAPHKMMFPNYTLLDVLYLGLSGIGWAIVLGPLSLAFRYGKASILAPLNYFENVFTLLADFFIFKYVFVITDYIGMLIIALWLIIPAVLKIRADI
jgi:drug/metabolite transporter (DMT)-like permease